MCSNTPSINFTIDKITSIIYGLLHNKNMPLDGDNYSREIPTVTNSGIIHIPVYRGAAQ